MNYRKVEKSWNQARVSHGSAQLSTKAAYYKGYQAGYFDSDHEHLSKPHVLTYEDLACEQGLQLLRLLMPEMGEFRVETHGEENDCLQFYTEENLQQQMAFDVEGLSGDDLLLLRYPNWQITLMNIDMDPSSPTHGKILGHDWEMPNGETVKAIFLPKNPKN